MSLVAGALLEPLAAPLLELGAEPDGALVEPLVEPPAAESFFVASDDEEALEEDDGVLGVVPEAALDEESFFVASTEPDAELELEPDGAVAEPDGVVVEPDDEEAPELGCPARRSPALSPQAVSKLAPKTIDTATAKAESLICGPPWLGYRLSQQGSGL